jgi:hypothetical protein
VKKAASKMHDASVAVDSPNASLIRRRLAPGPGQTSPSDRHVIEQENSHT